MKNFRKLSLLIMLFSLFFINCKSYSAESNLLYRRISSNIPIASGALIGVVYFLRPSVPLISTFGSLINLSIRTATIYYTSRIIFSSHLRETAIAHFATNSFLNLAKFAYMQAEYDETRGLAFYPFNNGVVVFGETQEEIATAINTISEKRRKEIKKLTLGSENSISDPFLDLIADNFPNLEELELNARIKPSILNQFYSYFNETSNQTLLPRFSKTALISFKTKLPLLKKVIITVYPFTYRTLSNAKTNMSEISYEYDSSHFIPFHPNNSHIVIAKRCSTSQALEGPFALLQGLLYLTACPIIGIMPSLHTLSSGAQAILQTAWSCP